MAITKGKEKVTRKRLTGAKRGRAGPDLDVNEQHGLASEEEMVDRPLERMLTPSILVDRHGHQTVPSLLLRQLSWKPHFFQLDIRQLPVPSIKYSRKKGFLVETTDSKRASDREFAWNIDPSCVILSVSPRLSERTMQRDKDGCTFCAVGEEIIKEEENKKKKEEEKVLKEV